MASALIALWLTDKTPEQQTPAPIKVAKEETPPPSKPAEASEKSRPSSVPEILAIELVELPEKTEAPPAPDAPAPAASVVSAPPTPQVAALPEPTLPPPTPLLREESPSRVDVLQPEPPVQEAAEEKAIEPLRPQPAVMAAPPPAIAPLKVMEAKPEPAPPPLHPEPVKPAAMSVAPMQPTPMQPKPPPPRVEPRAAPPKRIEQPPPPVVQAPRPRLQPSPPPVKVAAPKPLPVQRPAQTPPRPAAPKVAAAPPAAPNVTAVVGEGRAYLRMLERGSGPGIEIEWPSDSFQRERLYDVFVRCLGMRTAALDAEGQLYFGEGPRGQTTPLDADRFSGFVRRPAGQIPSGEQVEFARVRAYHAKLGAVTPARIFPRRVDAFLIGGLRQAVGDQYMKSKAVRATYRLHEGRAVVDSIRADGRSVAGTIDLGMISTSCS